MFVNVVNKISKAHLVSVLAFISAIKHLILQQFWSFAQNKILRLCWLFTFLRYHMIIYIYDCELVWALYIY